MKVEIILPKKTLGETKYKLNQMISHKGIFVPSGYVSDGASVPRVLWWLFPPTGKYLRAAIFHDWMLDNYLPNPHEVFREIMEEDGVNVVVRNIFYYSVKAYHYLKEKL